MHKRILLVVLLVLFAVGVGFTQKNSNLGASPAVTGKWSGTWGVYAPPALKPEPSAAPKKEYTAQQKAMDCVVEALPDGKWQATFEGECGRPYKYTIKMQGRQVGEVVMFSGTADLGEMDGGVYDWIGRANHKEFVGFFTSRGYTGTFRLARQ